MNYYNEYDPKTASWLRQLIASGLIPNGVVDERSITEVSPGDLRGYTQCHFFAGIAGWSYALQLAGWPEDRPVWTGSCPCQPFSTAGKGLAQADERHLWPAFFNLIRECRPEVVFGEQVASSTVVGPAKSTRKMQDLRYKQIIGSDWNEASGEPEECWLDGISADLEKEGYAVGQAVLGAHSLGSPHIRQRLYWVAHHKLQHKQSTRSLETRKTDIAGMCKASWLDNSRCQSDERWGESGDLGCSSDQEQGEAWERERGRYADSDSGKDDSWNSESGWRRVVYSCECDEYGDCPVCGIDYAECDCPGPMQDDEYEYREKDGLLEARRLGDSKQQGLEGFSRAINERGQSRRDDQIKDGPVATSSIWSNYQLAQCRDGKARRIPVESAFQPLAYGVPARVVRLRGYGNAIVPQVAAAFIEAFTHCEGEYT